MKSTIYVCDRCKVSAEGEPALSLTFYGGRERVTYDLCPQCLLDLRTWIQEGKD